MPTLTDTAAPETPSPLESGRVLGCYQDADGAQRTILAIDGVEGDTLVVDQSEGAVSDVRLVDHILADEPVLDPSIDNAALVAELYMAEPSRCRALRLSDLRPQPAELEALAFADVLSAPDGGRHRLDAGELDVEQRTLRWSAEDDRGRWRVASLRSVIGALDAYEPARSMTVAALAYHSGRATDVHVSTLAAELRSLDRGAFVLSRCLREAAQRAVARGEVSWSQLALRCGHTHAVHGGHQCGDTSWLKRRLGIMPDTSTGRTTPWIRSETLALIARALGVDPVSVEA